MIKQSISNILLTVEELRALSRIKPWRGEYWDTPPNNDIENIKIKIREQLEMGQNYCSYCGLRLGGTSRGEIEHIAPKAVYRHPYFTFTLKNLTLSCHYCNSFDKKGTKDTIDTRHPRYAKCTFNIVHPYFDNPDDHYEWTENNNAILIQVRNNSPKGLRSINMFKLDSPEMSEHRARQVLYDKFIATYPLGQRDEQLLKDAI